MHVHVNEAGLLLKYRFTKLEESPSSRSSLHTSRAPSEAPGTRVSGRALRSVTSEELGAGDGRCTRATRLEGALRATEPSEPRSPRTWTAWLLSQQTSGSREAHRGG